MTGVLEVSGHAVQRFRERVRPGLTVDAAGDELCRLLEAFAVAQDGPPGWVVEKTDGGPTDRWLLVGDDIAIPVVGETAMTVLVRGVQARPSRRPRGDRRRFSDDRGGGKPERETKAQRIRARELIYREVYR